MGAEKKITVRKIDIKVLLLAVVCVCFLSPAFQRTMGTTGSLFLVVIYLMTEINAFLRIKSYERNTSVMIILYLCMLVLYSITGLSDEGAGQTGSVLFFLSYFLTIPIYRNLERKHCVFIILVCIATIFVTMVQNYMLWVRMGYHFSQQWYRHGYKEVVNTQYVNAIMLFSGTLFCVFLSEKGKRIRYLFLALTLMCFAFNILVPQRTITTLLSIIMFTLLILTNVSGEVNRKSIIRYMIFILIILLFIVDYEGVLNLIANITNSDRIRIRIDSIITLLSSRDISELEEGSLSARLRLIGISINTFFGSIPNFLFGVGDKTDNLLVGNHSYFFDEFAKFGIFGGILSCATVLRMGNTARRISCAVKPEALYKLISMIYFVVILRAFVGGVLAPATGIVLYVFTPLVFRLIKFDKENFWEER